MKVVKDKPDTLIIKGYNWHRFAAAFLFMLLTPIWIWLAYRLGLLGGDLVERLVLLGLAAFGPFALFQWVRNTYKNWQLIFEAEYNLVAFHEGKWGARQSPKRFALDQIEGAEFMTYTYTVKNRRGRETTKQSFRLVLNIKSRKTPIFLGRGKEMDIHWCQKVINDWLSAHRTVDTRPSANHPATPLDS